MLTGERKFELQANYLTRIKKPVHSKPKLLIMSS